MENINNEMFDMILIRYGEMTIKKDNYKQFYKKIVENIKFKLKDFKELKLEAQPYRFFIYLNGCDHNKIIEKLNEISGLYSYSLCKKTDKTIDTIANTSAKLINQYVSSNNIGSYSFKVECKRSDKNYPLTSLEISKNVASKLLPLLSNVKVDVHNPDIILHIDFRFEAVYLYVSEIKGIGGYPASIQGKGLSMISGGLDSPVSTYLAIKKGIDVSCMHFFSPPYTSYSALQKVIDLVRKLSRYQSNEEINLLVVPFTKIQDKIHEGANNDYMVTLMRRAMYKIADKVCRNNDYSCIINGESIGQVASQTIESIKVVNEVTNMPIIRPLATLDKEDIVIISKQIDCFDISIRPYEDCCTVFVPKHPVIKPKLEDVLREENKINIEDEIEDAINNIKIIKINVNSNIDAFSIDSDDKDLFEI